MRKEDLFEALGELDDDIVKGAKASATKQPNWKTWGIMAACLCLAIAGGVIWRQSVPARSEGAGITVSEDGVTIPPTNVSLAADESACMVAFFIYQGRCYVQYERIYDDADIIGEYLGTAAGLIDEWTPKEGYVDLAGSVSGDFYEVKGYDPAFMLCMREPTGAVITYICDSGITLKYGSELYEDRLRLSDTFESVQYESSASWFYSKGERYQMNSVNDIMLDFIAGLDSAQFVPSDSVPLDNGQTSLADTVLYHLYFQTKNGITIHLSLHENGYVRFAGLWAICVQVPEANYNELLKLLDSRADSTAVEDEPAGTTFEDCRNNAELGRYVPVYAPEDIWLSHASIYYYLDSRTADVIGTKEISLHYESLENKHYFYALTITWAEEYGKNGWAGPMIDAADLSVESISEYVQTKTTGKESFLSLDVGVWYGDVSVVLSARGVDAETAYEILNSVQ